MQTILNILKEAGGWHPGLYLKIDNAPFMELVNEAVNESGLCSSCSLRCTLREQIRSYERPEMLFKLLYYSNNSIGVEHCSRFVRVQPSTRNIGLLTNLERLHNLPLRVPEFGYEES